MHEKIRPPKYTVLAIAMGWTRYHNEVKKLNGGLHLAETATELSSLWGIGEVTRVGEQFGTKHTPFGTVQDKWLRDNIVEGSHILFKFAPCGTIDGIRTGNPGRYIIPSFAIDALFDFGFITPTITEIYEEITRIPGVSGQSAPHDNGGPVREESARPLAQSPILIARTVVDGVI